MGGCIGLLLIGLIGGAFAGILGLASCGSRRLHAAVPGSVTRSAIIALAIAPLILISCGEDQRKLELAEWMSDWDAKSLSLSRPPSFADEVALMERLDKLESPWESGDKWRLFERFVRSYWISHYAKRVDSHLRARVNPIAEAQGLDFFSCTTQFSVEARDFPNIPETAYSAGGLEYQEVVAICGALLSAERARYAVKYEMEQELGSILEDAKNRKQ